MLEEYTRIARVVEGGKLVEKVALTEPELFDFEGIGTLEAVNTDGLRSLVAVNRQRPTQRSLSTSAAPLSISPSLALSCKDGERGGASDPAAPARASEVRSGVHATSPGK